MAARISAGKRAREAEIYRAAARIFGEKGFHATRIQDVAEALGMQKGSLYYYISSKEDLLRGLVEAPLARLVDETEAVLATRHPPPHKLALVVERHLRLFQEHKDVFGIVLRENIDFLDAASEGDVRPLLRCYDALWDRLLEDGIAAGAFAPDLDVPIVRKALIGLCNGAVTWFRPDGAYSLPEIARLFADLALNGVLRRD